MAQQIGPIEAGDANWLSDCWQIRPVDRASFRFESRERFLGNCRLADAGIAPCAGVRGSSEIERLSDEALYLTLYDRGGLTIHTQQDDITVMAGDILAWDPGSPGRFTCETAAHGLTIGFPKAMTNRRIGNIEQVFARRSNRNDAATALLFDYVRRIHATADRFDELTLERVLESLLDTVYFCFTQGVAEPLSTYRQALYRRADTFIRDNIGSGELNPASMAAHLDIAVRSVHELFAATGTTFSAHVRDLQLKQAKTALMSRAFAGQSITEIALRFGFFDLPHFTRTFRRRYGMSPRDYRKSC